MSERLVNVSFDFSKARGTSKAVLVYLSYVADEDGFCCPSVSAIAKGCRISDRKVQYAVKELIAIGALQLVQQGGTVAGYDYGIANLYRVVIGLNKKEKAETKVCFPL
jgi:hypothetical protein